MAGKPMENETFTPKELTQIDDGTYIYAIYTKKAYKVNGCKIFSLAFDLKAINNGTSGAVNLFSIPNEVMPKDNVSMWSNTSKGHAVQIMIRLDGTVKLNVDANTSISAGEGCAVTIAVP